MKRALRIVARVAGVLVLVAAGLIGFNLYAYSAEAREVWSVPTPDLTRTEDSVRLARGAHVGRMLGGCTGCHADDLGGGVVEDLGPIGVIRAPNLTTGAGGLGTAYSDAEIARAIRHGVRRDGTSLRFMPTPEHNWWPDEDLEAVVSWVRTFPPVDREVPPTEVGVLGKLLHRAGIFGMFSAQQVDHDALPPDVPAGPTAEYGALLTRQCTGCHGDGLAGGKLPGAPASLPVPRNLTAHETGLEQWSEADFATAVRTGVRPDGTELLPFMPRLSLLTDDEIRAMWIHLREIEPRPFGER